MNRTLKSLNDIIPELRFLDELDARLHQTFYKNWDLGMFLRFILDRCDRTATILDVGCVGNPLLFNLAGHGYSRLYGIDSQLSPQTVYGHAAIRYLQADLMRTPFRGAQFDCVTSLSVVEHGVDIDRYFGEMARILKPAGVLLTSTDYWPRKIRTWAVPRRWTFGLPWRIFSEKEIRRVLGVSHRHGFTLQGSVDLSAEDTVVHFLGKAYTFVAFALEKPAS